MVITVSLLIIFLMAAILKTFLLFIPYITTKFLFGHLLFWISIEFTDAALLPMFPLHDHVMYCRPSLLPELYEQTISN